MKFNGKKVLARSKDQIELETDEGLMILRGYDKSLIVYDTLDEVKRDKRIELILAFDAEYTALWTIDGEVIEAWKDRILFKAAANRTAAENAKLTQAAALFDKLQTKLTYLRDPVRTEAEVNALSWTSTP